MGKGTTIVEWEESGRESMRKELFSQGTKNRCPCFVWDLKVCIVQTAALWAQTPTQWCTKSFYLISVFVPCNCLTWKWGLTGFPACWRSEDLMVTEGFALRYGWPFKADCCRAHWSSCVKSRPVWLRESTKETVFTQEIILASRCFDIFSPLK